MTIVHGLSKPESRGRLGIVTGTYNQPEVQIKIWATIGDHSKRLHWMSAPNRKFIWRENLTGQKSTLTFSRKQSQHPRKLLAGLERGAPAEWCNPTSKRAQQRANPDHEGSNLHAQWYQKLARFGIPKTQIAQLRWAASARGYKFFAHRNYNWLELLGGGSSGSGSDAGVENGVPWEHEKCREWAAMGVEGAP